MINAQIQTGKGRGMALMDQSLQDLVRSGTVEPQEALERSYDKEQFKVFLGTLPKTQAARG
jgi:Tfp pilus assembly pilus retraction ATPase PilT